VFSNSGGFLYSFNSTQAGGLAINEGKVYLSDTSNNKISVFDTTGNLLSSFGSSGNGDGQLSSPGVWVSPSLGTSM
jgi:DNA-binding beta-propeller fold protein YncE